MMDLSSIREVQTFVGLDEQMAMGRCQVYPAGSKRLSLDCPSDGERAPPAENVRQAVGRLCGPMLYNCYRNGKVHRKGRQDLPERLNPPGGRRDGYQLVSRMNLHAQICSRPIE